MNTEQPKEQACPHDEKSTAEPFSPTCAMAQCPFQQVPEKIWQALLPKPFRKRHPILFWGFILLLVFGIGSSLMDTDKASSLTATDSLAVVRIEGVILDNTDQLKWIRKISQDDSIKGVLLRVDSPGGGAGASQELYEALRTLNAKKPVVASLGSTAASGGVMVSVAARYIVANASTVTGSIGVRMDMPKVYKLMETLGLGQETITTAPYKDAGSPLRPMTDKEKAYFSDVVNDMHQQFVGIIAEGRNMPAQAVQQFADGKVFTGRKALELGLVDALGGQDKALAKLYELTKVAENASLKERPDSQRFFKEMMESALPASLRGMVQSAPEFLYQW